MDALKEFFAIALFVLVAAVFLKMVIGSVKNISARAHSPVVSVTVDVLEKHSEIGLGEFTQDGVRLGKGVYSVDFRTDEGDILTFQMSKAEFDALEEGVRGHLSYREKIYLGFAPDGLA